MMNGPSPATSHPPSFQTPPAALADVLNHLDEQRDSAYFSSASTNGEASKHNSIATQKTQFISAHSQNPNHQYRSTSSDNMTPSPINGPNGQPLPSPTTSAGMPLNNMVTSPISHVSESAASVDKSMLARLNQHDTRFPHTLTAPNSTRASVVSQADSRRDSVDGRMTDGLGGLRLTANSPYASANQSTTSIQSSLQQQRNPGHPSVSSAGDRMSGNRFSAYAPNSSRFGPRTAPTITGPATSAVANAAEPTKGMPWAFPDDVAETPASNRQVSAQVSFIGSRRSSIAESFASSQFTESSRLPPGQRRLEEGYSQDQIQRLSRASSEYVGQEQNGQSGQNGQQQPQTHHHHTLQNRVGELRDEEGTSPGGTVQPYSRTPELRKSHKLAERKRRCEMKELYDQLKEILPSERGSKTSKWEILYKSIQQHKHQEQQLTQLDNFSHGLQMELQDKNVECRQLRNDVNELRNELREMKIQMQQQAQQQGYGREYQQPPVTSYGPGSQPFGASGGQPFGQATSQPFSNGFGGDRRESSTRGSEAALPPLRSLAMETPRAFNHLTNGGPPARDSFMSSGGPDAMAGVQYQNERSYGGGCART